MNSFNQRKLISISLLNQDNLRIHFIKTSKLLTFFFKFKRNFVFLIFFFFILIVIYFIFCYNGSIDKTDEVILTTQNNHKVRLKTNFYFTKESICRNKKTEILEKENNIFQSVLQENIKLIENFNEINKNLELVLQKISNKEAELKDLELRIEQLQFLEQKLNEEQNVYVKLPNEPLLFKLDLQKKNEDKESLIFKTLDSSIDYRRCSITSVFQAYLYEPLTPLKTETGKNLYNEILNSNSVTKNINFACILIAIFENNASDLKNLKFWNEYGRNHLIILINGTVDKTIQKKRAAALFASQSFDLESFNHEMDFALNLNVPQFSVWEYQDLPQLLPFKKKYLISFFTHNLKLLKIELDNLDLLKKSMTNSQDLFLIETNCTLDSNNLLGDYLPLCYNKKKRIKLTRNSYFSIIFFNCKSFQQRFYEALMSGSIPVITSTSENDAPLPFQDFIDWRLASIRIAASRIPELHFILRSITASDLLEMRRKGRFFLETYLSNTKVLFCSIYSALRFRIQALGIDLLNKNYKNMSNSQYFFIEKNSTYIVTATRSPYDDEYLGPNKAPNSILSYLHNFTAIRMFSYKIWNEFPLHIDNSPEFFELDYPFPSEAEFDNKNFGIRQILPGSGDVFSMSLGGNRPEEQFTIVITTFNRNFILNASLERLYKLPYLNRVIVVWNNLNISPTNYTWPSLHVPLIFVKNNKNSLNNRFLPYKEIKTEAVLSLDDDIDLKQYEIIFAFRTWREQRHKIVGFPARYHAKYGNSIFYNSNHTCQISIILTGAAFFHKSYFYAYTYLMPEIIRKKVDEWKNCEDLAMNFLVSHLTRQPPIKVTNKWTIRCPKCFETLSDDLSHFNKRHNCIKFFTQVYGYNPLLFSQFRVDSVLFKTRVPPNYQKCFKYV